MPICSGKPWNILKNEREDISTIAQYFTIVKPTNLQKKPYFYYILTKYHKYGIIYNYRFFKNALI